MASTTTVMVWWIARTLFAGQPLSVPSCAMMDRIMTGMARSTARMWNASVRIRVSNWTVEMARTTTAMG